jgi:hypothetical protein
MDDELVMTPEERVVFNELARNLHLTEAPDPNLQIELRLPPRPARQSGFFRWSGRSRPPQRRAPSRMHRRRHRGVVACREQ